MNLKQTRQADKGNSVVILNKRDYIERMTEMLSDIDKFKKLNVKPGKELNLLLKHEDKWFVYGIFRCRLFVYQRPS